MTSAVAALFGAAIGVGCLRLRAAWLSRRDHVPRRRPRGRTFGRRRGRLTLALLAAIGVWWLVGWPVLGATAAVAGWFLPDAWAARGRAQREQAVVEAVATWAEQLRDTLSAASGLEHAVAATAAMATGPLAAPLHRLAERLAHQSFTAAVRHFAVEVRHPSADFVAAALITSSEHQAREVGALLGHLALTARDEARLRRRVWVGRARTRAATRLIAGVVAVVVAGLKVFNPDYLDAYAEASGQVVLGGIILVFVMALVAMERLSRLGLPERFSLRVDGRREAS